MKRFSLLFLMTWLVSLPGLASDDDYNPAGDSQRFYQELLDSKSLPGAALLVEGAGEKFNGTTGTIGPAGEGKPWDPDLPFYIASIGKTFIAVAVMQLWDRQLLGLDDTLTDFLEPEITDQLDGADRITVRQLLNHTAGLWDATEHPDFIQSFIENPGKVWTDEEVLAYIYGLPLMFEPGSRHDYADTNYLLLAMIIQRVTGEHASAVLRRNIIDPLDLQHTYYLVYESDGSNMVHGFAYADQSLGVEVLDTQPWAKGLAIGAAPLISTTEDISRFFRAIFKDKRLLSRKAREEILQHNLVSTGRGSIESYGFGLNRYDWGNIHSYAHDGGFPGYYSIVQYFPEYDLVVAGLFNFTLGEKDVYAQPSRLEYNDILATVLGRLAARDRD